MSLRNYGSLGNTRGGVVAATAAVAAMTTAAWWWVHRSIMTSQERYPTRQASCRCACGKCQVNLIIPPANYSYMEIPSFQCACEDCVDFCETVLSKAAPASTRSVRPNFCRPGAHTIVLYDSEVQVLPGCEAYLVSMKLSKESPNRRIYTSCCGTPMAISVDGSGLNLVYTNNIVREDHDSSSSSNSACTCTLPDLPPTVCIYYNRVKDPKRRSLLPPGTKKAHEYGVPKLAAYCLSRMLLLAFVRQPGPGKGFPVPDGQEIAIGLESIQPIVSAQ